MLFRSITYLQGTAEILSPTSVRVDKVDGTQETVTCTHMILATGSVPAVPPMLRVDDPRVMDSTGALELKDIPKSLLVVGGGYIGLELGSVYAVLGSKVTVVEMMSGLLPGADRDLVDVLAKKVAGRMDKVLLNTRVTKVVPEKKGIKVKIGRAHV